MDEIGRIVVGTVARVLLGIAIALAFSVAAPAAAQAEIGAAWGRLLASHVAPGRVDGIDLNLVDYQALRADPDYAKALADLDGAKPEQLESEAERLAFWINAYNLLAIEAVVDRYPIASIKDGGNFLFPIWKKKVGRVGGREYSLDEIEHGILRKDFDEPRIHFAIVCASLSCPDLRPEPYESARLDAQLDDQTRAFLANRGKGLVPGPEGKTARVSSIFRWFGEDFSAEGGVAEFIRTKAGPPTRAAVSELTDAGISYLDYDWSLNDRARAQ